MSQDDSLPSIYLGELDIPASLDWLYLFGDTLALFNFAGALVRPGGINGFALDRSIGQWVLCDAERVDLNGFTPEKAVTQFHDFTGEHLEVVVAGYARKAYQLLEPTYPGFTDRLLAQLLIAPVPDVPKPRAQILDLNRVLQAYGASLVLKDNSLLAEDNQPPQLVFTAPVVPVSRPTDTELVLTSVTLFVAQLNITPWLLHVVACDPDHEIAQLLGAIARHELAEPAWGGVLAKLLGSHRKRDKLLDRLIVQPFPLSILLSLLGGIYTHPENPEDIYAELPVFRILRACLDENKVGHPSPQARETLLAGIIDGLEQLAIAADQSPQVLASLRFAQSAQVVLQLLLEQVGPPLAEAWFSRVEAQEQRYSWRTLAADHELDQRTVWYFANYTGSAALAVKQHSQQLELLFEQSKITNHLWTAVWRVLNQLRKALRLCYALIQQQPLIATAEGAQKWMLPLQHLLAHYQQLLKELVAMIERSSQSPQGLSHWATLILSPEGNEEAEGQLMQELLGCMQVYEALESQGYGPVAIQQLGKLIATMPEAA
ncbi:hypothetical protein MTX78_23885 (plasmid) [Hymenobacter tibetensis]|uniref:Uncharacterized protein n=1 Tax=Hymenobacter tibetensis TaxID=497967 RepID=A0ABY4D5B3_9BACT|nr:hypothetical protein [Hymenobacter tibetensis]UOG77387.1 hypothetical protein MTX78_23885 [Hymenobacter tibetensis]